MDVAIFENEGKCGVGLMAFSNTGAFLNAGTTLMEGLFTPSG